MRLDDPLEPLLHVDERPGHDLEEAVLLRLEVVVERRRADMDLCRDVGPLRLLVAVTAEEVDRYLEDSLLFAPGCNLGDVRRIAPRGARLSCATSLAPFCRGEL